MAFTLGIAVLFLNDCIMGVFTFFLFDAVLDLLLEHFEHVFPRNMLSLLFAHERYLAIFKLGRDGFFVQIFQIQ